MENSKKNLDELIEKNEYKTLMEALEVAEKILNGKLLEDNANEPWDIENLMEEAKTFEEDEEEDGYYCVGIDGSVGYTKDSGYSIDWLYKSVNRQRYDVICNSIEIAQKDASDIEELCTIYGPNQEPVIKASFDDLEDAKKELKKYQTSVKLMGNTGAKCYLVEEYYVESSEFDSEDEEWTGTGEVFANTEMPEFE